VPATHYGEREREREGIGGTQHGRCHMHILQASERPVNGVGFYVLSIWLLEPDHRSRKLNMPIVDLPKAQPPLKARAPRQAGSPSDALHQVRNVRAIFFGARWSSWRVRTAIMGADNGANRPRTPPLPMKYEADLPFSLRRRLRLSTSEVAHGRAL
jgi:hypothetical protein